MKRKKKPRYCPAKKKRKPVCIFVKKPLLFSASGSKRIICYTLILFTKQPQFFAAQHIVCNKEDFIVTWEHFSIFTLQSLSAMFKRRHNKHSIGIQISVLFNLNKQDVCIFRQLQSHLCSPIDLILLPHPHIEAAGKDGFLPCSCRLLLYCNDNPFFQAAKKVNYSALSFISHLSLCVTAEQQIWTYSTSLQF